MRNVRRIVILTLLSVSSSLLAWNDPKDTAGPLTVVIEPIGAVEVGIPVAATVTVRNAAAEAIEGVVRLAVIDDWRVEGERARPFRVAAKSQTRLGFQVVAGPGTYAAHYPIHAYADFSFQGQAYQAHPIALVLVSRKRAGAAGRLAGLPQITALTAVQPLVVDGVLREWDHAVAVALGPERLSLGSAAPGDYSTIFYALHDAANLYLGLKIADDDVSCADTSSRDFVNSEYVRLYLSPVAPAERHDSALTKQDAVLAISPFGATKRPLLKLVHYDLPARMNFPIGQVKCAARKTESGYDVEIGIPLSAIGTGLEPGSMLGFNMMLGDADRGRREAELTVGAQAGEYWTNPGNYVPLALSTATRDDGQVSLPVIEITRRGATALDRLNLFRVQIERPGKPLIEKPLGWFDGDKETGASFTIVTADRGGRKRCIGVHPPWREGFGVHWADYRLSLPDVRPISLTFANAIRDHTAKEPPSDGVEFRVLVSREGESKQVFRRFTAAKRWEPAQVDLSAYAGQTIVLRLWCGPGPKNNTLCDSGYWAEPTLVAGTPPKRVTEADRAALRARARQAVERGEAASEDELVFRLGTRPDACVAAVALGEHGLFDGAIAFGARGKCVAFDGLCASILGDPVGQWPSPIVADALSREQRRGRIMLTQQLRVEREEFPITVEVWPDRDGLRIKLDCPKRITDLCLAPADQEATRVYYGHGYCIVEPEAFHAGFGGHNLSTSHVGFDFEQGVSLLTACDNPPDYLKVNPKDRVYALHTHHNATLTFVPSLRGAFDCARRYRPLYDKSAAGGVKRKAGRFCFDIWGGRYAQIAETMQRMIDYGCTDSFLTVHNWQRWGYDYRLPDIYPPNARYGTVEDMRKIAEVCAKHDVPWGLHDNYIDFYPDADDYTYGRICFSKSDAPCRAWTNHGRDAQSYRWRPDCIMPFVQRNLKLMKPAVAPTHYFIDVFTSIGCFDYYDVEGQFHSSLETRKCWGEAFAWIRDYLGGNAPTTSETGHDQLTGYLDGADCQHLQLTNDTRPPGQRYWFCIRLLHKDWERVPWFDAVLHDKFILHGVGYSGRYQGGRSRRDHGIESDDYLSAEILGGHALMIDWGGFGRGGVRKYWLAQDFIRSIALDGIEGVQFVDGDIHRQIVSWASGGKVWVNRGESDWAVAGKVLPQCGYLAKNGEIESSIERINGVFVEQSRGPRRWYFNARTFGTDKRLRLAPSAKSVEYLGGSGFKLAVEWQAHEPAPKDLHVFVHFDSPKSKRSDGIAFQGGGRPPVGTSRWKGRIVTGAQRTIHVPNQYGAGEYEIVIGLWDPSSGRRYGLLGENDGDTRYRLGKLVAEGKGADLTNIRLVKHEPKPESPPRLNLHKKPIDFGPVVTDGAFRLEVQPNELVVTPLPESPAFSLTLRLDRLPGLRGQMAESLAAVGRDGSRSRAVEFRQEARAVSFETRAGEFAYAMSF